MRHFVAILLLSITAVVQHQVPQKSQCQAEANVWRAEARITETATDTMDAQMLLDRAKEMYRCYVAYYPTRDFGAVADIYDHAVDWRMERFLMRHNLISQFLEEDAAGKR